MTDDDCNAASGGARRDAFNPLGVRGIGELGITAVAAVLATAAWHATGKRVRELPVTLDKVL